MESKTCFFSCHKGTILSNFSAVLSWVCNSVFIRGVLVRTSKWHGLLIALALLRSVCFWWLLISKPVSFDVPSEAVNPCPSSGWSRHAGSTIVMKAVNTNSEKAWAFFLRFGRRRTRLGRRGRETSELLHPSIPKRLQDGFGTNSVCVATRPWF